jgi:hypothetical protein
MSNIKNFDSFVNENYVNESWRQVKAWLKIPQILFEELLHKLIKFVPRIGILYDKLSAKIDTGSSISPSFLKEEPIKLTLDDIKNDSLRKTLKISGIFNKWNVYTFDRTRENRQPIYITKDELKIGDKYYGERLSDWQVDNKYSPKNARRLRRETGGKEMSELEPQFWVICALETEEHNKMRGERDERYTNKKDKELEKLVKDEIKRDEFTGRTKSISGQWNNDPLVYKIIYADRVDLMQKLIDACEELDGKEGVEEMLKQAVDNEGWYKDYDKYGSFNDIRTPLKSAKSEEMKDLIKKYIG